MKSQKILLIISFVIAVATGYLVYNYLSVNKPAPVAEMRDVVVAVADIPARATITPAMLTTVRRSSGDVDQDALNNPRNAVGFLALTTIPKGAAIVNSRIGRPDEAPLPARLKPGMRALTIPIDAVRGVAGLIEPGDHIDVIAVLNPDVNPGGTRVRTVLHDLLVLAIGTSLEQTNNPQTTTAPAASTATLAVTAKQAEQLTLADSVSQLRLALRPPGDKANRAGDGFTIAPKAVAAPPARAAAAAAAPVVETRVVQAAPAATPKPAPHELIVTVIDGDHVVGAGK